MGEKAGVVAALESLGATAEPSAGEFEQLELLPGLPAPIGADGVARPRTGGRPAGARNKSTEEWRRYLVGQYGSPLEALLRLAATDTDELAKANFMKRGDALAMQKSAMEAALPYLHQKLPQAVEVSGEGATLYLQVSQTVYDRVARPADGTLRLGGTIEGNQGVGDDEGG